MSERRRRHKRRQKLREAYLLTVIVLAIGSIGIWWIVSIGYKRPKGIVQTPRVELIPTASPAMLGVLGSRPLPAQTPARTKGTVDYA